MGNPNVQKEGPPQNMYRVGFIVDCPHKLAVRILDQYLGKGKDKPSWIRDWVWGKQWDWRSRRQLGDKHGA